MTKSVREILRTLGTLLIVGAFPAGLYLELSVNGLYSDPTTHGIGYLLVALMIATGILLWAIATNPSKHNISMWISIVITGLSLAAIAGFVFNVSQDPTLRYAGAYEITTVGLALIATLLWIRFFFDGRKYVKGLGFIKSSNSYPLSTNLENPLYVPDAQNSVPDVIISEKSNKSSTSHKVSHFLWLTFIRIGTPLTIIIIFAQNDTIRLFFESYYPALLVPFFEHGYIFVIFYLILIIVKRLKKH